MKGVFNLRPPLPRYKFTWDVSKVLNYLEKLFPLDTLGIKELTLKLAALLALCSAQRAQVLVSLNIKNMLLNSDSVVFYITNLMKTSRPGKVYQTVIFKKYNRQELCPVFTLKKYLEKTKLCRKTDSVLISFRTNKEITTSTLARWLKTILESSGIDSRVFRAHSYRGASTSAAYLSGVKLDDIMKMANWQAAKTFKKFYLRDTQITDLNSCVNEKFAGTILSLNNK